MVGLEIAALLVTVFILFVVVVSCAVCCDAA